MTFKLKSPLNVGHFGIDSRSLFLKMVGVHAPGVLAALERDVYPSFCAIVEQAGDPVARQERGAVAEPEFSSVQGLTDASESDVGAQQLLGALHQWADRFHIGSRSWRAYPDPRAWQTSEHWVLETALHTCSVWREEGGGGRNSFRLPGGPWMPLRDDEDVVTLECEPDGLSPGIHVATRWLPDVETRAEVSERLRRPLVKKHREHATKPGSVRRLEQQLDSVEALFRARTGGQLAGIRKFEPKKHLEWTVLYQLLVWSYGRIARANEQRHGEVLGEDTIAKAVRLTSEHLGLVLREPGKGGWAGNRETPNSNA